MRALINPVSLFGVRHFIDSVEPKTRFYLTALLFFCIYLDLIERERSYAENMKHIHYTIPFFASRSRLYSRAIARFFFCSHFYLQYEYSLCVCRKKKEKRSKDKHVFDTVVSSIVLRKSSCLSNLERRNSVGLPIIVRGLIRSGKRGQTRSSLKRVGTGRSEREKGERVLSIKNLCPRKNAMELLCRKRIKVS